MEWVWITHNVGGLCPDIQPLIQVYTQAPDLDIQVYTPAPDLGSQFSH